MFNPLQKPGQGIPLSYFPLSSPPKPNSTIARVVMRIQIFVQCTVFLPKLTSFTELKSILMCDWVYVYVIFLSST